jgi:hypothetical protein
LKNFKDNSQTVYDDNYCSTCFFILWMWVWIKTAA